MKIPEAAYEAATQAEFNHWGPSWPTLTYETDVDHREYLRLQIERAVESAAPFIAAQALRDEADRFQRHSDISQDHGHQELCESFERAADILREDADGMDPQ